MIVWLKLYRSVSDTLFAATYCIATSWSFARIYRGGGGYLMHRAFCSRILLFINAWISRFLSRNEVQLKARQKQIAIDAAEELK